MKLKDYLAQPGVTASGLGRAVGVSHSTVLRWADETITPALDNLRRLHVATGGLVAPNDFLTTTSRPPKAAA